MKIHELKTIPKYFELVRLDRKHFEWRNNDREFTIGDFLWLREWDTDHFTDREELVKITEIVSDTSIGIPEDYVIMEIVKV